MLLLLPGDPLNPRRVDPHLRPEADAARDLGIPVALVDHDALAGGGDPAAAVARVPACDDAVYRGWMLRSEQYAAFADALAARGCRLRTSPAAYRTAHELPGWYGALSGITPESVWSDGTTRADVDRLRAALGAGPAVLRDHVKSMKHHWHEAAYIPDLADGEATWRVVARFLELREDALVGGLVLRRFERFTGAEVRTWWVGGRCALIGAHPDTADRLPPADVDVTDLTPLVAALGLPFVTVDLVRREDGVRRVVELGDGQVSDRPTTLDPQLLLVALAAGGARG